MAKNKKYGNKVSWSRFNGSRGNCALESAGFKTFLVSQVAV
jgi:catalase (peroxidase I)